MTHLPPDRAVVQKMRSKWACRKRGGKEVKIGKLEIYCTREYVEFWYGDKRLGKIC